MFVKSNRLVSDVCVAVGSDKDEIKSGCRV